MKDEHKQFFFTALGIEKLATQLRDDNCMWGNTLCEQVLTTLGELNHGDLDRWIGNLQQAPNIDGPISLTLDDDKIALHSPAKLNESIYQSLHDTAFNLKPWRKGPYHLFELEIDSEWRSDIKWQRLAKKVNLVDKKILDVGCANGYFGWRMLGAGAKFVVGIDPGILFILQFLMIKQYAQKSSSSFAHNLLPFRLKDLPPHLAYFDTVFSMGVLYHRRCIFDHLLELKDCLKPGGDIILETLVIPPDYGEVLVPEDRYARMRNVWFIPTSKVLCTWLKRAGFIDMQILDESITTLKEQRKTKWIDTQSLEQCLDEQNPSLTVEGYPAPMRSLIHARRP